MDEDQEKSMAPVKKREQGQIKQIQDEAGQQEG
jgi:hypothetical protein